MQIFKNTQKTTTQCSLYQLRISVKYKKIASKVTLERKNGPRIKKLKLLKYFIKLLNYFFYLKRTDL